MSLDEARKHLFDCSRKLNRAHEKRMNDGRKTNWPLMYDCQDADRALQLAAIQFAFELAKHCGNNELADSIYTLKTHPTMKPVERTNG